MPPESGDVRDVWPALAGSLAADCECPCLLDAKGGLIVTALAALRTSQEYRLNPGAKRKQRTEKTVDLCRSPV